MNNLENELIPFPSSEDSPVYKNSFDPNFLDSNIDHKEDNVSIK